MHETSPERWRELQRILDLALDAPRDRRVAVLDAECAGDASLRAEAGRLLASCDTQAGFLDTPAAEFAAPLLVDVLPKPRAPGPGTTIGDYVIVRELAHGGMGSVYVATRAGASREVALKLVRPGMESERIIRRFVEERRILASIDHPDIARLLDGGVTAEGVPFLVMELIDGQPIDRYCDTHRLPIDSRLELFCRICDAVRYAHRQRIVHRDLKPANIIVAPDGNLKLLDFGIAKLLAETPEEVRLVTTANFRVMTPEFASPEQLRGEAVTTASDVYSLGILLSLLLCGHHPYRVFGLHRSDLTKIVLRRAPEPPSVALMRIGDAGLGSGESITPESVASARATTVEALRARLTGALDTIALGALAVDVRERYASPDLLATAIRRELDRRSSDSGRTSLGARLRDLFHRDAR
jgi:serine/threonine protein kinase